MTGLRRVFLHASLGAVFLTSCSREAETFLPVAGKSPRSDAKAEALLAEAKAADRAGQAKRAMRIYDGIADRYPHSSAAPQARFRHAQLLERDGALEKAFEAYGQVITRYQGSSLYPQARDSQAKVAHAAADGQITKRLLWMKPGLDPDKIISMLETVRDNAPQAVTAAKAQYTIGGVYAARKSKVNESIEAYQKVVDDHPRSSFAPLAQFKIGNILLTGASRGNQDNSNLDRAMQTFEDLRQSYPGTKQASEATLKMKEIRSREIQRSLDIGEFYFGKGQGDSAAVYYREVMRRTTSGKLHEKAKERLRTLGALE